ncbi:transmembrane protein 136 isoform X2 [Lingula anatina]|uniref:Transmembrane protein 136 isoform X2 n=1 Tax=Lingula anatina TaxID=7574 RepID=A0A1S3I3S9_LINAN|nr:transmembrane protein 136 isoform X2 [Lingula anatina]|eukprot:XP_013392014.1 transmembrane protein 136 isoform X2 [Lingula anatina]
MSAIEPVQVTYTGALCSVLAWVLGWATLYFVLCVLNSSHKNEWNCRIVSAVHAITVCCLAFWAVFVQGPWVFTLPGGRSSPLQQFIAEMSLGYFLYDFMWCIYFKTEGFVMLLHHCLSSIGLGVTVLRGMYGTEMVATLLATEVTNPFLQFRWFLRQTGQYETLLGEVNDILFMALFGFARIGMGTSLLITYYQHPNTDFLGKFGGTCIYIIGWLFWISIMRFALKKYTKMYHLWKKGKLKLDEDHYKIKSEENGSLDTGDIIGDLDIEEIKEEIKEIAEEIKEEIKEKIH